MNTFLDLLIVVVLALTAVSLVAMVLMFLVKNRKVSQVCFWIIAALGIYMGYVGLRIMWVNSLAQSALAVLMALIAIGSIVLERLSRDNHKMYLAAQIMASTALIVGMFNAFM